MGKHRKHIKLKLRNNDEFSPNEMALLGTKCSVIQNLVEQISKKITNYKLAYLDAEHNAKQENSALKKYTFLPTKGAIIETDYELNKFNQRIQFSQFDYVFINGNHFKGAKQILILDGEKEASLKKRLDNLTHVQFVIKLNEDEKLFNFLLEKYPSLQNLNTYHISEIDKISKHIKNLIEEKIAPVQGFVLAGGKSERMGKDKGELNYFGENQRDYVIKLLKKHQLKTYLSVREEQHIESEHTITDKFLGLGPFGAICSAFQHNPNRAWLVLATDLPFVNDAIIKLLLKHRNPSKIATAIKGKTKEFPEPLITIWEPKSYPILLNYLAQGYSCPRKVLINNNVEIVEVDDAYIRNINTPTDFDNAVKEING